MPGSPSLAQYGPALTWLLSKDVSSSRLASLFGTTPENIRIAVFRQRREAAAEAGDESPLREKPDALVAATVGIRTQADEVVRTPAKTRQLDELRKDVAEVAQDCASAYRFLDGVSALRRFLPRIGYAGDARRVALCAEIHQRMAWFLVHCGRCESASREALMARSLWRRAYHESGDRDYGNRFVEAALIGSHASLLIREPRRAWDLLGLAAAAADSIRSPVGSDLFRQRGVALFQLREDERSAGQFKLAAETMERRNEATDPAQLVMTGARHTAFLHLDCDNALEISVTAKEVFGELSLEASMALHWAVAASLSTDSPWQIVNAINRLLKAPELSPQFGHQASIRKLLTLTPDLGLDDRLRRLWVRRTLYENAFRRR